LILLIRLSVCVNHGSTFELNTTLTEDALGAKAAAEAGNSCGGMVIETRTMFGGVDFFGDGGGGISETIGRHNVIDLRIKTISRGCTG
jgi:hypothetical protein